MRPAKTRSCQRALPPNDPKVAESLFYFGANQIWLQHVDIAEQYYEQAIAIERKLPFEQADQLPYMLLDLFTLPSYRANPARAEAIVTEAHDLFVRRFGPEHITVAFSLQRMGNVRVERGDYAGARPLLTSALGILDKRSASPIDIASIQETLADALAAEGDAAGAAALRRQVLSAFASAYGPNHVVTASAKNQLAWSLITSKQYAEAARLSDEVIAVYRLTDNPWDTQLETALLNKAWSLEATGRPGGQPLVDEAIRIIDHLDQSQRCDKGRSREGIVSWYELAHRHAEAARQFAIEFSDLSAACGHDSTAYQRALKLAPNYR